MIKTLMIILLGITLSQQAAEEPDKKRKTTHEVTATAVMWHEQPSPQLEFFLRTYMEKGIFHRPFMRRIIGSQPGNSRRMPNETSLIVSILKTHLFNGDAAFQPQQVWEAASTVIYTIVGNSMLQENPSALCSMDAFLAASSDKYGQAFYALYAFNEIWNERRLLTDAPLNLLSDAFKFDLANPLDLSAVILLLADAHQSLTGRDLPLSYRSILTTLSAAQQES